MIARSPCDFRASACADIDHHAATSTHLTTFHTRSMLVSLSVWLDVQGFAVAARAHACARRRANCAPRTASRGEATDTPLCWRVPGCPHSKLPPDCQSSYTTNDTGWWWFHARGVVIDGGEKRCAQCEPQLETKATTMTTTASKTERATKGRKRDERRKNHVAVYKTQAAACIIAARARARRLLTRKRIRGILGLRRWTAAQARCQVAVSNSSLLPPASGPVQSGAVRAPSRITRLPLSPHLAARAVEAHAADRQRDPAEVDRADDEAGARRLGDLLVGRRVVRRLGLVPLADEPGVCCWFVCE